MLVSLYNFDHQLSRPGEIKVGSFRIEVSQQHCLNLNRLFRHSSVSFTQDGNFNRVVEKRFSNNGDFIETAIVHYNDGEIGKSRISPETPGHSELHDLTLLLSFLTGRRVYLDKELEGHPTTYYTSRLVGRNFFQFQNNQWWEKISVIEQKELSAVLYAIVYGGCTYELIGMSGYFNSAFDVITTKWASEHGKTKYTNNSKVKQIISLTVGKLDSYILGRSRDWLVDLLKIECVPQSIIQDISARLKQISSPSALYKTKQFLQAYTLFPNSDTDEANTRLRWLNMVRNSVAHYGDIPSKGAGGESLSYEERARISGAVILLIGEIVKVYLGKYILKLDDYSIGQSEQDIQEYFERGTFREHKIFEESYAQFMSRIENDWIENGNLS